MAVFLVAPEKLVNVNAQGQLIASRQPVQVNVSLDTTPVTLSSICTCASIGIHTILGMVDGHVPRLALQAPQHMQACSAAAHHQLSVISKQ